MGNGFVQADKCVKRALRWFSLDLLGKTTLRENPMCILNSLPTIYPCDVTGPPSWVYELIHLESNLKPCDRQCFNFLQCCCAVLYSGMCQYTVTQLPAVVTGAKKAHFWPHPPGDAEDLGMNLSTREGKKTLIYSVNQKWQIFLATLGMRSKLQQIWHFIML